MLIFNNLFQKFFEKNINENKMRILAILTNGGMRMKEGEIRVLMVEPNEYPEETRLKNLKYQW